ncbi:response regulator [Patescibacteria group bacterium]|nr:response regulator [Patescibacteria group bacterium]
MKILLVDDDNFLRDMYATKFSQTGHTVDAVDNGAAALTKLSSTQDYDVVMLDMVMPGMSGLELLVKIREEFPKLKAKLIVLSNQGQEEDIREATAAGACAYIIKAESVPSEVLSKVEAVCG